jgi:hypothetical protein
MINFLLGFWAADLLFSIILYFKKEIVLNLDKNVYLFTIIVDIFLLSLLLFLKYGKKIRKSYKDLFLKIGASDLQNILSTGIIQELLRRFTFIKV